MKTVAVILAGGKSSRMGRDKAMLPVNGTPLVAMLAERWRNVFDGLVLSVDTRERFAHLGLEKVQMVEDARPEAGPLAALETVMTTVPAERYFLTAVDLPFGNPELALALSGRMGEADVCLIQRRSRDVEPLFSFYSHNCLPAITAALDRGERSFYRGLLPYVRVQKVPEDQFPQEKLAQSLFNANTPEDWEEGQKFFMTLALSFSIDHTLK